MEGPIEFSARREKGERERERRGLSSGAVAYCTYLSVLRRPATYPTPVLFITPDEVQKKKNVSGEEANKH